MKNTRRWSFQKKSFDKKKIYKVFKSWVKELTRPQALFAVLGLLTLYIAGAFFLQKQLHVVILFAQDHLILGAIVYVLFFALSIVIAPISSLPIMYFTEEVFGVLVGGVLSTLGWWTGGLGLFLLARFLGRSFLLKRTSLKKIKKWEKDLPEKATFWGAFFANAVFPTELVALLFGCFTTLSFRSYALASLLGILPFSFLLVASGGALFEKNWMGLGVFGGILVLFFLFMYLLWFRYFHR